LIEVNCAALPKELLESELFGHESGAFTDAKSRRRGLMEQANGGTLFLDEIAELTLELQAKVLKAIEDKMIRRLGGDQEIRVDARIIVATNRNLQDEVAAGRFRADLFHRLDVFRLDLPALRDRREDLADLVPAMVAEFNAKSGRRVKDIPSECWRRLHAHDWPGNVRELRNVIERCVLFSEGDQLSTEWLQVSQVQADGNNGAGRGEGLWLPLDGSLSLEEMDRAIIKSVLESHDFNILASARALGTTRETLRYRIQKYRLECGG
jgi:two-component system response regulator AtoC